jgi:uncharacterized membrane protein
MAVRMRHATPAASILTPGPCREDIYTIDESLINTLRTYLQTLFGVASTVVVISFVTPIFMACLVPMILFYASEQKFFMVRDFFATREIIRIGLRCLTVLTAIGNISRIEAT